MNDEIPVTAKYTPEKARVLFEDGTLIEVHIIDLEIKVDPAPEPLRYTHGSIRGTNPRLVMERSRIYLSAACASPSECAQLREALMRWSRPPLPGGRGKPWTLR